MWHLLKICAIPCRPAFVLALLICNHSLFSQEKPARDTVFLIQPLSAIRLASGYSFFSGKALNLRPDSLIPSRISFDENSSLFYNSLESKASRFIITRKLYDLIVVSNHSSGQRQVSESSQSAFSNYSGKVIRNITIRRLEVFGTDINNPLSYNPKKTESFLNKTHLNTNEFIIRNNLLFSQGDTVSPLVLSDNERLLRELPFIDESRIIVLPSADNMVDILVLTKDVYSIGGSFEPRGLDKGSVSVFEKNLLGLGHEFRLNMAYDPGLTDSPGFGVEYNINNILKSFVGLNMFFFDGLGEKTYGFSLSRKLVSSYTRYAGGISIKEMFTSVDLESNDEPEPLKYNLQDYWFLRSFMLHRQSVSRLIFGIRYTNNNVFDHPFILPDSYSYLQKYRFFLGSVSFSMQKYYKTNLIYGYGRTEDIPYGGLITITGGREINENTNRNYAGIYASTGHSIRPVGYFCTSAGISTFIAEKNTAQGMLLLRTTWFSNLLYLGSFRMRNFVSADYTRGFDRYVDEYLSFKREDGLAGLKNDSVGGTQRLALSLESVLFSPVNLYGFRFAFYAFGNIAYLFGTNQFVTQGEAVSGIGLGVRIRNDNLVFPTFQFRLSYFPKLPQYSRASYLLVSGEQLLRPDNFDPGPPTVLPYR